MSQKNKNEHYYGSELNRFIDEKCSHQMTCINIDCLLVKIAKKRIRIIESKHSAEFAPKSQITALKILHNLIQPKDGWHVEFLMVYSDYPYNGMTQIEDLDENVLAILNQQQLIKWLNFEIELNEPE